MRNAADSIDSLAASIAFGQTIWSDPNITVIRLRPRLGRPKAERQRGDDPVATFLEESLLIFNRVTDTSRFAKALEDQLARRATPPAAPERSPSEYDLPF